MDRFSSSPKDGLYAWCIWFLAALTYSYAFFHRVAPSVMVAELMSELAISGAMLGTLSALYFYPYVLLQIPLGALLETIGVRRLLSSALLLAGLGSFLFGVADSIFLAYLGRVLIGIGSSVGFLGSLALAAKWFAPSRYGFLSGLTMFYRREWRDTRASTACLICGCVWLARKPVHIRRNWLRVSGADRLCGTQ